MTLAFDVLWDGNCGSIDVVERNAAILLQSETSAICDRIVSVGQIDYQEANAVMIAMDQLKAKKTFESD
jgi:hypothetical protein